MRVFVQMMETTIKLFGPGRKKELVIDEVRAVPCGLREDKPN